MIKKEPREAHALGNPVGEVADAIGRVADIMDKDDRLDVSLHDVSKSIDRVSDGLFAVAKAIEILAYVSDKRKK